MMLELILQECRVNFKFWWAGYKNYMLRKLVWCWCWFLSFWCILRNKGHLLPVRMSVQVGWFQHFLGLWRSGVHLQNGYMREEGRVWCRIILSSKITIKSRHLTAFQKQETWMTQIMREKWNKNIQVYWYLNRSNEGKNLNQQLSTKVTKTSIMISFSCSSFHFLDDSTTFELQKFYL